MSDPYEFIDMAQNYSQFLSLYKNEMKKMSKHFGWGLIAMENRVESTIDSQFTQCCSERSEEPRISGIETLRYAQGIMNGRNEVCNNLQSTRIVKSHQPITQSN